MAERDDLAAARRQLRGVRQQARGNSDATANGQTKKFLQRCLRHARGFIFASAAALKLGAGFVPVRKKGKLPFQTHEQSYELEYGSNTIAIHTDAVKPGSEIYVLQALTGG